MAVGKAWRLLLVGELGRVNPGGASAWERPEFLMVTSFHAWKPCNCDVNPTGIIKLVQGYIVLQILKGLLHL